MANQMKSPGKLAKRVVSDFAKADGKSDKKLLEKVVKKDTKGAKASKGAK